MNVTPKQLLHAGFVDDVSEAILSSGIDEDRAKTIENKIVRVVAANAARA